MNYESLFRPTVDRLNELVQKQYGCEFVYQTVDELKEESLLSQTDALSQSLRRGESINAGDWIFIPIFLGKDLTGAARVSKSERLSRTDMGHLHQMVRMVLESKLHDVDRLEMLDKLEAHLSSLSQESEPINLIQFRDFRPNLFPLENKFREGEKALNFPFLIESKNPEDSFKMALEIHTRTNRYAFLSLEDINPSTLESPEGIHALGSVTLFIQDITVLTFAQQQQILNYYNSLRDKDSPQFVAASQMPLSELKKSCKIQQDFLKALLVGYLCMTQPFSVYKRENLLEFFYDSLTGRTSI
jgi:hypothetical protein